MKTTAKTQEPRFEDLPRDYSGLVALLPPRTIHDAAEFANITELLFALGGHKLTPDQEDYADLLSRLVEDWEKENVKWPRRRPTGLECLKHLLAENAMTASDLARLLGVHRSLGTLILQGKRQLTVGHIQILAKRFCLSGNLFLQ